MTARGARLVTRGPPLAAVAALVFLASSAGLPTASAAGDGLEVDVVSLRHVAVTMAAHVPGPSADLLRVAIDANEDGSVSGEEYAVYVSTLERLVFAPPPAAIDLYEMVWELENTTGAAVFTPGGRFTLGATALGQVPGLRASVALDGEAGSGRVSYLVLAGLAGPVRSNATVDATATLRFEWEGGFSSYAEHLLVVEVPPLMPVELRLPGGFVAENVSGVAELSVRADGAVVRGTTTGAPVVVEIAPRGGSTMAFAFAVTVIVAAVVVVAYGSAVVSRQHAVSSEPGAAAGKPK